MMARAAALPISVAPARPSAASPSCPRPSAVCAAAAAAAAPVPADAAVPSALGAVPLAAPGKTTLAFVGIGIMGHAMAANLLKAGYDVVVWNRSPERCQPLVDAGARLAATPADAARTASIVFGMLADPPAALAVATGPEGVAAGMSPGKGYVDASTVDAATSAAVAAAVRAAGGLFLEAPVSGSKGPAEQGQLVFLTAGDAALFAASAPALEVMGKASLYLGGAADGAVGAGAAMKLVVNQIMGTTMAALAEGLALASACGLAQGDVLRVASLGAVACPMFALKGPAMAERRYAPAAFPLKHQLKDLRLSLEQGAALGLGGAGGGGQGVAEAALAAFARAEELGRGDDDFSAVLEAVLLHQQGAE